MKQQIIQQGAEAVILRIEDHIIKDRISKGYRNPELDRKLIKQRTKSEAKILEKASRIIPAPLPEMREFNKIEMPFIEGKKLSEHLEQLDWRSICKTIGEQIAKLHDANIIHGDLTTSNMIWVEKPIKDRAFNKLKLQKTFLSKKKVNLKGASDKDPGYPKLYFIDFGLGFISKRIEDKAVDLHLIKQALEAKHFSIYKEAEKIILENYNSVEREKVLQQLEKVEARGRYKKRS